MCIFTLFLSSPLFSSETGTLKGRVTDRETKKTLAGASVLLTTKTTAIAEEIMYVYEGRFATLQQLTGEMRQSEQRAGAIVQQDGSFVISNLKPGEYTLTVRYTGFKKHFQNIVITPGETLEIPPIALSSDPSGLQEVVVTGVASRTAKENSEVAVGRINMAELTTNIRFSDPIQALVGKVPGVYIQFSNGILGSGARINVRSSASLLGGQPVIFIDGVRSTGLDYHTYPYLQLDEFSPLATLAPDDIETIEILKGPVSSSLYGTSGQNGVVLISTKRGRAGSSPSEQTPIHVNYRFNGGFQTPSRYFSEELTLNAANANRIFRTAPLAQHQISLEGAIGNKANYYLSLSQRNEQGILPGNDVALTTVRMNADFQPLPGFITKISASLARGNYNLPLQNENRGVFYGWIRNTLAGDPYSGKRFFLADSVSIAAIQNNINLTHLTASVNVSYMPNFLPGLRLHGLAALEEVASRGLEYYPPSYKYSIDTLAEPSGGSRVIKTYTPERMNFEAYASYTHEILSGFTATYFAGVQAYDNQFLLSIMGSQGFQSPLLRAIQTGTNNSQSQNNTVTEIDERSREAGIFVRFETKYKDIYFLSSGIRNDYASTIGRDAPSIFYPQASFAVRFDKMGILPSNITLFKLRGGYGESGKLPTIRNSQIFWKVLGGPGLTLTGGSGLQAYLETPIGNTAIRPERVREIELGAEIEINDTFGGDISGFYQISRDAILDGALGGAYFTRSSENSGRLYGWGAEAQFFARAINTEDVTLQLNLVASYSDNVVDSLGSDRTAASSFFGGPRFVGATNYLAIGQRRGLFMDRPPIAPRYLANGYYDWSSGPILDTTLRPLGSSVPLAIGSFSWTLTLFRDITFYGIVEGGIGRFILNGTRQQSAFYGSNPRFNTLATQLGLATGQPNAITGDSIRPVAGVLVLQPNTKEYQAAAVDFMRLDPRFGSIANYLERGDWIRLRELSLRWNARTALSSWLSLPTFIRTLVFGISARNVFLWTTYSGADVEINSPAGIPSTSVAQGSDIWSLMQARTMNFHIEIGF